MDRDSFAEQGSWISPESKNSKYRVMSFGNWTVNSRNGAYFVGLPTLVKSAGQNLFVQFALEQGV